MKISGINSSEFPNIHIDKKKNVKKADVEAITDRVEISSVGKSLSGYSSGENFGVSAEKLNSIKNELTAGTYNRDSKLVAQKIIDTMKGREI